MRRKHLIWVAAVLGTVSATGSMGCRRGPAAGKGATSASSKALSVNATNAKMWVPPITGMAVSATGTPWVTGRIYNAFDFGSGFVASSGSADIYLVKLDPTTCLATATFVFGGRAGNDQASRGVAVASKGNVGMIGQFTGEIEFTDNKPGTDGLDFLRGGSGNHFYGVFDGASTGAHVTPVKTHTVDLGFGALLSVGSNPGQNAFAICGKTDKAVLQWSSSAANEGLITGGKAVAGGEMDIVVAKIDAATGSVIWGKQFGGVGNQVCESVTIDNNGDVLLAGGYSGALSFGGISLPTVADATVALLYVARLNGATGAAMTAKTWGFAGRSNALGLTVDADGNVIVAGSLGGDVDFGGGINITNLGWTDAFVVKLTPALAPIWAKSFGDADFDQQVKSVGVSSKGDVLIGGSFQGSLGTLGLTSAGKTAASADAFTAELAKADGAVLSAHAYGDAAGAQAVSVVTVARSATGALANSTFIGGSFSSEITFAATTLNSGKPTFLASYVARLVP